MDSARAGLLLGRVLRSPSAVSSSAWRLDAHAFALREPNTPFRGQILLLAADANRSHTSGLAVVATIQAIRTALAPVGQQRGFHVGQQLEFAHDAVTA